MSDLATQLRDAVSAWLERTGTAPARLGAEARGDPSFVLRLLRGRIPQLDTADKMLAFIGEPSFGPAFRAEVQAFIEVTGTKPYVFGLDATGNPSFVARLRRGASPRLDKAQRVLSWMAANCGAAERAAIRAAVAGETRNKARTRTNNTVRKDIDEGGSISMNDQSGDYIGTREAAAFLGLSPRTLDRYRVTGEGPAMTSKTSEVEKPWIGSQSNHCRPARLLRSLRCQGERLARAGLSAARIPIALTMRPPKRGCAFR